MGSQPPSSTGAVPPRFDDLSTDVPVYPLARVPAVRLHPGASPHAPDIVVIMQPNASRQEVVPRSSPEEEPATSPEILFQARDEETAQDERSCIQAWVLCAAIIFPVVFSSWLLLVPYLARISGAIPTGGGQAFTLPSYSSQSVPAPTRSLSTSTSTSVLVPTSTTPWYHPPSHSPSAFTMRTNASSSTTVTSSSTTVPVSTSGLVTYLSTSATVTSPSTTTDLPHRCIDPLRPTPPPANLRVGPHYGTRLNLPLRPFFCMYNNWYLVQNTTPWHFMFETLPFALCPHVIYSSVAIVNGTLTSRLPSFDRQHGLHQLRNITDRLGFPRIKILLTLGGYQEDAPHFSRLGRDMAAMNRLMRSVITAMSVYRLNGVTVDWRSPRPGCGGSNDPDVLALLLGNLRQAFNRHRMGHIISVVLLPDRAYEAVVDNVAHVVNYFFIGSQITHPSGPVTSLSFCSRLTLHFHAQIGRFARHAPRAALDQLCIVERLSPLATFGSMDLITRRVTTGSGIFSVSFYDICRRQGFCRNDSSAGSCVSHFMFVGRANGTSRPVMYVANSDSDTLSDRANLSGIRGPPGATHYKGPCVVAWDLHLDNFAKECDPRYNQYLLIEHLYYATLGQNATGGSLLNAAPAC